MGDPKLVLGLKEFVIHYDGGWGKLKAGEIRGSDYNGGEKVVIEMDRHEFCLEYLKTDVEELDMFEEKRSILEPTGVLVIAGAEVYCKYYGLKNETVVAIASGAKMNFSTLKLVAKVADIGRQREAVLSTCMTEEPGSFKRFCELVGPQMNITEFKYRCDGTDKAIVFVRLHTISKLTTLVNRMEYSQLEIESYTSNGLVKEHLRYLVTFYTSFRSLTMYTLSLWLHN
ncbi:hypothetical protein IFM89_012827 [Coptis chinensis]|uniref:ACT-like domain-containing protein n=1 Tax=Coptis chinensis TaxID=261450 RepID=A0A835H421_9MAGN|nr:hypothetical protein IFM89_012827 [Coptis chinensis]